MKSQQKVLVTGAGKGIGREIAISFALHGASVMVADSDETGGLRTVNLIAERGCKAFFCKADISDPVMVDALIKDSEEKLGGIGILVNNAGFGIWKSPYDLTIEEWDSVINTNLRGAFLCSRKAAEIMKRGGDGCIINIASTRAFMSEPGSEAYAASKGGLVALTHALAASLSNDRIRVNCISPGWIETGDYSILKESDHLQHFSQRVGKPSDIAQACIFLAENDFINGENIIIDGGMTKKMIYLP
ncbi:MAG: SDR family oxidoreductase [Bacteroidales bacterium]|jgi:NAD(P)-dependent dehydrogenase (short-subunit alcohol dehydrogenase family)|nr:SDR family oxidoreductase [Bacteroidales bacterium]